MYVDVNLSEDESHRLVVYDQDTPEILAANFCKQHMLDKAA